MIFYVTKGNPDGTPIGMSMDPSFFCGDGSGNGFNNGQFPNCDVNICQQNPQEGQWCADPNQQPFFNQGNNCNPDGSPCGDMNMQQNCGGDMSMTNMQCNMQNMNMQSMNTDPMQQQSNGCFDPTQQPQSSAEPQPQDPPARPKPSPQEQWNDI